MMNAQPKTKLAPARGFEPSTAPAFVLNCHYEKLLTLRAERPAVFENLSTPARVALIHYEAAKIEFEKSAPLAG